MFGYRVPAPSQAMLISGGKQRTADGTTLPFKIVVLVRGTNETFIAYSDDPVDLDETVLVFSSRGNRAVDVTPAPWAVL